MGAKSLLQKSRTHSKQRCVDGWPVRQCRHSHRAGRTPRPGIGCYGAGIDVESSHGPRSFQLPRRPRPAHPGRVEDRAAEQTVGALRQAERMVLSRRWSAFLLAVAGWSWIIWPTFLRNIWADPRSFSAGPTSFLIVHLALVAASLGIAPTIGVLGWRGWQAAPASGGRSGAPGSGQSPAARSSTM